MSKVFISGPMRGYQDFNFPHFHEVALDLRIMDHTVWSPAINAINMGFNPKGCEGTMEELEDQAFDLRAAFRTGVCWLLDEADCLVALDGWENSTGATAEVQTALAIGLPIYTEKEIGEI